MKWNSAAPVSIFKLSFYFFAFIIFSIFLLSCSQSGDGGKSYGSKEPIAKNWIDLRIKFKENSTQMERFSVLASIEKILVDTIEKIRKKEDPNFLPVFSIKFSPFEKKGGGIEYEMAVHNGGPQQINIVIPCTCQNNCRICDTVKSQYFYPETVQRIMVRNSTDTFE